MIKILKRFYNKITGRQVIVELRKDFAAMQQQVTAVQDQLAAVQVQVTEARNDTAAVQQQVTAAQGQVAEARNDTAGMQQQITGLREALLALRYHARCRLDESLPLAAKLNEVLPISEQFDRLQQQAPHAYTVWRPLLDVNEGAYEGLPIDSCSVSGHPVATLFRFFLAPYLKGCVLDIGCGPQKIPIYLEDHPIEAVYGIDPLSSPDDHAFNFIRGVAEYLPWDDAQFDVVIAATSLDHVLLLDKVFEEVCRVLSGEGIFVIWEAFIPGSKPYDPLRHDIEPVDDFHLFHFDRDWFMDAIKPYFTVLEEFSFVDNQSNFFALRPSKLACHDR